MCSCNNEKPKTHFKLTEVFAWATTRKKSPSSPNPPQLNSFLTFVVDRMPVFLNIEIEFY